MVLWCTAPTYRAAAVFRGRVTFTGADSGRTGSDAAEYPRVAPLRSGITQVGIVFHRVPENTKVDAQGRLRPPMPNLSWNGRNEYLKLPELVHVKNGNKPLHCINPCIRGWILS